MSSHIQKLGVKKIMNIFNKFISVSIVVISFGLLGCSNPLLISNQKHNQKHNVEKQVQKILSSMSLEEKVAQMIQAEIKFISPSDLETYPLGSILNGGGSFPNNNKNASVADWIKLADRFYKSSQKYSKIPLIWGTDAVHGHNNVIGATIFPHNIGLGAANNSDLIKKITEITAKEVLVTGQDWIFAPTVAVVRDDRWGRTYEGYSEDPEIVKKYAFAAVRGLQGNLDNNHVIATAKHFIGDGGTQNGKDQGDNISTEEELIRLHAQGYKAAINAGVQTVMASFNSWNGKKVHGHRYLLTEVLKNRMGFDGFVIGDWNGHGQVEGCSNESCPQAINAGVDMIMVPEDWKKFYINTLSQVQSGEISMNRINDAVTRILRVKLRYGKRGPPSKRNYAMNDSLIGGLEHRKIARQAVRESLVLLKNNKSILPLDRTKNILVMGSGAQDISKSCGGWTVTWQGTELDNKDFPKSKTIFDTIKEIAPHAIYKEKLQTKKNDFKKIDVAIVVFGEDPYAEGQGDLQNLSYNSRYPQDLALLKSLKAQNIPVVSIFLTGRPLWVNPEINMSDAFVVAWLPGTEVSGITDVIFKNAKGEVDYDFKGRLSYSWPNHVNQMVNRGEFINSEKALFPYGYGLDYSKNTHIAILSENSLRTRDNKLNDKLDDKLKEFLIYSGRPMNSFDLVADTEVSNNSNKVMLSKMDRVLQEDSIKVSFSKERSELLFLASGPLDLSLYSNADVKFFIKLVRGPVKKLASMKVGLNDKLVSLGRVAQEYLESFSSNSSNSSINGQWIKIKIPVNEFIKQGLNLKALKSLKFITTDDLTIGLSEIIIE